jgi:hypothetical protein
MNDLFTERNRALSLQELATIEKMDNLPGNFEVLIDLHYSLGECKEEIFFKELYRKTIYAILITELLTRGSANVSSIYYTLRDGNIYLNGSVQQFIHQLGTCWTAILYDIELYNKHGRIPDFEPDYEFLKN